MEPQIKGVVVISLPPEDDPSKGKTITAASTLAETSLAPTYQNQSDRRPPPIQERQMGFPPRMVFRVKRVMSLLGVAVLMFLLRQNGLAQIASDFGDDDSKQKDDNSCVYTLYPKYGRGVEQDVALRLGRAIRRDEETE